MQSRLLIALIAPSVLTGCLAQSDIQAKYMSSQSDCRDRTARSVSGGETARPVSESQATPIAQRFSECMTKEGWHLATPRPGSTQVVQNPPSGSPSTNPHAAAAVVASSPPATAYPPQSSYPTYNAQTGTYGSAYYPPSGAPSVNPSAAAVRAAPVATGIYPQQPTSSYYQQSAVPTVARTAPGVAAAGVTRAAPVGTTAAQAVASPATSAATSAASNAVRTSVSTAPRAVTQTSATGDGDTASYQPGRPSGEATPAYGSGPGRQF